MEENNGLSPSEIESLLNESESKFRHEIIHFSPIINQNAILLSARPTNSTHLKRTKTKKENFICIAYLRKIKNLQTKPIITLNILDSTDSFSHNQGTDDEIEFESEEIWILECEISYLVSAITSSASPFSPYYLQSQQESQIKQLISPTQAPQKNAKGLGTLTILSKFGLVNLKNVEQQPMNQNTAVLDFGSEKMDILFVAKGDKDIFTFSILKLFQFLTGAYPKLLHIDLQKLEEIGQINECWNLHPILKQIFPPPMISPDKKESRTSAIEDEEKLEEEQKSKAQNRILQMNLMASLENNDKLFNYAALETKLKKQKKEVNTSIIKRIQEKQKEMNSLCELIDNMDFLLESYEKSINLNRNRLSRLKKSIATIEVMNKRITIEKQNKKKLYTTINSIVDKYDLSYEFKQRVTNPPIHEQININQICMDLDKLKAITEEEKPQWNSLKIVQEGVADAEQLKTEFFQSACKKFAAFVKGLGVSGTKIIHPLHPSIEQFFSQRKELIDRIQTHFSDKHWQIFIKTIGEAMTHCFESYLINLYDKMNEAFQSYYLPSNVKFNFLQIHTYKSIVERAKDTEHSDINFLHQFLEMIEQFDQVEQFWINLLSTPSTSEKEKNENLNSFMNNAYFSMSEKLITIIEKIGENNPILLFGLCAALGCLESSFKSGVLHYLAYEWLDELHNYELKTNFEAMFFPRHLNKIVIFLGTHLKSILDEEYSKLENYACNTRYAGVLLPTININIFMEKMLNYSAILRTEAMNNTMNEFLNKFLLWLDSIAQSKPKYYEMVIIENYHYLMREWKLSKESILQHKYEELKISYSTYVDKYIQNVFQYEFKDFFSFFSKLKQEYFKMIENNEQADISSIQYQSTFSKKIFQTTISNSFKKFGKHLDKLAKRMNKHMSLQENVLPELWVNLNEYIIKEYELACEIGKSVYQITLTPQPLELQNQFMKINIQNYLKK